MKRSSLVALNKLVFLHNLVTYLCFLYIFKVSVMEKKYATCPNSNLNSKAPKFRVHNLCAGFIEGDKRVHVIDSPAKVKHPDMLAFASEVNIMFL